MGLILEFNHNNNENKLYEWMFSQVGKKATLERQ